MTKKIERDHRKFRKIIRGSIKKSLKKFISHGSIERIKGKKKIKVPIHHIDIPHFEYGNNQGQGQGPGSGQGEAGDQPGEDILEVELTLEELAEFLGEELELPNIQPKGIKNIEEEKIVYTGISRTGPESLRQFKRTFKEALKRQIMAGEYDFEDPIIIPIKKDKRYRTWKTKIIPETSAVVFYMMDASGSMRDEQIRTVKQTAFWIDTWLNYQYKGLKTHYILHDTLAKEVSRDHFFRRASSGGTKISSAYKLWKDLINLFYPPSEINIYGFHFSDGDNWEEDSGLALKILAELVPKINLFGYAQIEGYFRNGGFINHIRNAKIKSDNLILTEIKKEEDVYNTLKIFLGKGK